MTLNQLYSEIARLREQACRARMAGHVRLYLELSAQADRLSDDILELNFSEACKTRRFHKYETARAE